jgi:hypothetical protein
MTSYHLNASSLQQIATEPEKFAYRSGKQLRSLFLGELHGVDEFSRMRLA